MSINLRIKKNNNYFKEKNKLYIIHMKKKNNELIMNKS